MDKVSLKQCSACKSVLLTTDFHRNKASRDGFHSMCKGCNCENSRRQRLRSREALCENSRRQRLRSREALCEQQRMWNARNAERLKPYKAQYYQEHHQEIREQSRAAYAAGYAVNPSKYLAKCHARRAALHNNGGSYTPEEWEALCARYGNICLMCHRKVKLTVDHIIPISHGGSNDIANLQPLCRSCNARKGDKIMNVRKYHEAYLSGQPLETE